MERSRNLNRRSVLAGCVALAAAAVLAACGDDRDAGIVGPGSGAEEVESYDDVSSATQAADAVVRATAADVAVSRVVVGDSATDRVPMIGVTLRNPQILAGTVPDELLDGLVVEFTGVGGSTSDKPEGSEGVKALTKDLAGVDAVYFLRKKVGGKTPVKVKNDPGDGDYYRLASFATLAVEGDGGLVNPLFDDADDDPFVTQLAGIASLDDLVAQVRAAAG